MATNISVLEGHLTKDPELKVTGSGKKICSFTVANNKLGKDAGANYIDCVAWEGRGETISKYFKKGSQIVVTGRLDQQAWKTKDGQNRSKLVIIVDDFSFVVEPFTSLITLLISSFEPEIFASSATIPSRIIFL